MRVRRGGVGGVLLWLFGAVAATVVRLAFSPAEAFALGGGDSVDGGGGAGRLSRGGADSPCVSCHAEPLEGGHPMGVAPRKTTVPAGWPLDASGRLACETCHERCGRDARPGAPLQPVGGLRTSNAGWDLCAECHGRKGRAPARGHARMFALVHVPAESAHGDGIDATSRQCLQCHDGTAGGSGDVDVRTRGTPRIGERASSHPIGVSYPPRPKPWSDGSYVPRAQLDRRILLPEGRVGCLSCHDLFGQEEKLLVMSNRESRLCYQCHEL
ncbi:MAG: hypothetical protein HY721_25025 [Planctomycetes bacterium]|nr:hypothetical protein [Planctomycetota bacterium]